MKKIFFAIVLLLLAVSVSRGADFPTGPATVTAVAGLHPAVSVETNLLPQLTLELDHGRGHTNVGLKSGLVGMYMNGRHSRVVTGISVEGRLGSDSVARVHVSQHGYHLRSTDLEWGAFAGSDFGVWGKALVNKKVEFCAGKYDNLGSRGGVYYILGKNDRAGVAYSSLLGVYVNYRHSFRWSK